MLFKLRLDLHSKMPINSYEANSNAISPRAAQLINAIKSALSTVQSTPDLIVSHEVFPTEDTQIITSQSTGSELMPGKSDLLGRALPQNYGLFGTVAVNENFIRDKFPKLIFF